MVDIKGEATARVKTVRLRTWLVTATVVIGLVFYLLVIISLNKRINLVDFIIMSILQTVGHLAYFPDGEIFGANSPIFVANRKAYNEKANAVNANGELGLLRKYCKEDYERRKKQYIETELGALNLTEAEYKELQKLPPEKIKKLVKWEYDGQVIIFGHYRRKRLYRLLFRKIPIEANTAETVLSAVENTGYNKLSDKTTPHKVVLTVVKFLKIFVWGLFLAYLSFTARNGIGLPEIARFVVFLGTLISSCVSSFSAGERTQKVYKNEYYVELSNFLDGYEEWKKTSQKN